MRKVFSGFRDYCPACVPYLWSAGLLQALPELPTRFTAWVWPMLRHDAAGRGS